ncbi:MAG: hypothetical protein IKG67_14670 [Parasporobacterium sp.]|nr:hypothetical protein [Parasporobacterium sp.]
MPVGNAAKVTEDSQESSDFSVIRYIPAIPFTKPEGKLNGCNSEIVVPAFDLSVKLHEGENMVSFTPDETGTIPYSCRMGMIKSNIKVVE